MCREGREKRYSGMEEGGGVGDTENRKNKGEDGSRREERRRLRMKIRVERKKRKEQQSLRVVGRKGKDR